MSGLLHSLRDQGHTICTVPQAAEILGVSQARVKQLIKAERLHGKKFCRDWLLSLESVASYEPNPVGRPANEGASE